MIRKVIAGVLLAALAGTWLIRQQQTAGAESSAPSVTSSVSTPPFVAAQTQVAEQAAVASPVVRNEEFTFSESELAAHCQSRSQGARSTLSTRLDMWLMSQLEPVLRETKTVQARYRFESVAPDKPPGIIAPPWDGYDDATLQKLSTQGNVQATALLGLRLHIAARNNELKREQREALHRQAARLLGQAIRGGEHELLLTWGDAWTPLAELDESQVPAPNSRAHFDRRKEDADQAQANADAVRELARERGPFILRLQVLMQSMISLPLESMLVRGDKQAVQARKEILLRDYPDAWRYPLSRTEQDVVDRLERAIATQRKVLEAGAAHCEAKSA